MMKNKNILKSLLLLSFMAMGTNASAQNTKVAANTITATNGTYSTAVDGIIKTYKGNLDDLKVNDNTFVKLTSGTLILAPVPASVSFNYTNDVAANTPYYFRVNTNDNLLNNLLGGSIGGFLGSVLFGQHIIKVNVYDGNTNVLALSSDNYWSQSNPTGFSLLEGPDGNKYIKVVPTSKYNKVEYVDYTASGVAGVNSSELFFGYYNSDPSRCDTPIFTSYSGTGGLVSLLSSPPVTNASNAIDNDLNTASTIGIQSLLNINAGGTIEQFFHMPEVINDKSVKFKLRIPSGLLSLNIADQSSIVFYNNGVEVFNQKIDEAVLGLDLLGLVNYNSDIYSFSVSPKDASGNIIPYDRVGVRFVKPLSVNLISGADLEIYDVAFTSPAVEVPVCTVNGTFDLKSIIPNYNVSTIYTVTDVNQQIIDINVRQPLGSYLIKGINNGGYCPNETVNFVAVQDKTFKINGKSAYGIQQGSSVTFDPLLYTTTLPTGSTIKIFDELTGEEVTGQTFNFPNLGSYNYYAQTINAAGTCEVIKKLTVFVYDINTCDYRYIQKHATDVMDWNTVSLLGIPLGAISNRENAGDNDLSTHSTITNVVSLLGIGTTWQDIKFDRAIAAGTPVTLKLGQEYSLLQLIGAISLRPINSSGAATGSFVDVGETDLLNALVGDNVFEFTFVPKDASGENIDYSGVRVHLGSVLGVGNSMNVFGAYIDERLPLSSTTCEPNIVVNGVAIPNNLNGTVTLNSSTGDVLWGVEDIGIGAATAISGVVYPYLAADNDLETFAEINQAASLLNAQTLTIKFKEIARPGDKVRVIMGKTNVGVLDLSVLGGFTIQKYLGDVAVGDPLNPSDFSLIDLNLLGLLGPNNSSKFSFIMNESNVPFDRVELRFTNILNVQLLGSYPKVYDVSLVPFLSFDSFEEGSSLCANKKMVVEKIDICTEYNLSFATPVLDVDGAVTEWTDIAGSNFIENTVGVNEDYSFSIPNSPAMLALYNQAINSTGLYIKIVTMRQECQYGDIQYLRVGGIENCSSKSIANPMIRSRLKNN